MTRWMAATRGWMILAFLGAILSGCAGRTYQAARPAVVNGGRSEAVQIYANGGWRDSGINVVKGETYQITAKGRWSNGGLCGSTDASGGGLSPLCAGDPWGLGISLSSLIGRIGPHGRIFGVGTNLDMVASSSGHLYLRDYDVLPFDNTGFQNVTVTPTRGISTVSAGQHPTNGTTELRTAEGGPSSAATPVATPTPPPTVAPLNPPAGIPLTGKRVALVVGMGAYEYVHHLRNPTNDARLMARTLKAIGFQLVGGGAQINLDKHQFDHVVQLFGRDIENADVALFYYAGHGLQVNGVNWLVPVSANPTRVADLAFQMVNAELVLQQMQAAGTKLNIVLLDACRNNPFGGGRGLRAISGGLAQMQAPEGTLISYSTQPGNVAQDGAGADSPYTTALVRAIDTPGLDIFRLFNQVGLTVKKETGGSQLPWVSNSPISGDFYINPKKKGA